MKKAFTLLEILFTLLIIGVLTAVAIPKLQYLYIHTKLMPLIESYQTLHRVGRSEYLNLTELNAIDPATISMSDILHVNRVYPPTTSDKNKKWVLDDTSAPTRHSDLIYYIDSDKYISYRYFKKDTANGKGQGTIKILIRIRDDNTKKRELYKKIISEKLGIVFTYNRYVETYTLINDE